MCNCVVLGGCCPQTPMGAPAVQLSCPTQDDGSSPPYLDRESRAGGRFQRISALPSTLNRKKLDRLVDEADRSASASLVVLQDGHLVVERYFGNHPASVELRSVTKSVAGLAIGILVGDGRIRGLDEPLSTWFPEWVDGLRSRVTLRHVLEHTSGIEHEIGDDALAKEPDSIAYVRAARVLEEPGTTFSYNNNAVQLLSAVVRAASGEDIDRFVDERVFRPLGIRAFQWARDPAGTPYAYTGLSMGAVDLASVGQLLLDNGKWRGRTLVPQAWIQAATQHAPMRVTKTYGLLFEYFAESYGATFTEASLGAMAHLGADVRPLAPLQGKAFETTAGAWLEAGALMAPAQREDLARVNGRTGAVPFERRIGRFLGFGHSGSFGQYLIVLPSKRTVVVRLATGQHPMVEDVQARAVALALDDGE